MIDISIMIPLVPRKLNKYRKFSKYCLLMHVFNWCSQSLQLPNLKHIYIFISVNVTFINIMTTSMMVLIGCVYIPKAFFKVKLLCRNIAHRTIKFKVRHYIFQVSRF